jgi:hypothetical protein
MQFRVRTADETLMVDGLYEIEDSGVLKILPEGDSKPIVRLSPAHWREITESWLPEESSPRERLPW